MTFSQELLKRRHVVIEALERYCAEAKRNPQDVLLLAVSKGQSLEKIRIAYELGQRDFGENYLVELENKRALLSELDIRWHFIGTLQSNKIKRIVASSDVIHTLASVEHAKKVALAATALGKAPAKVYLAVNIDREPQKSGCYPENVAEVATAIAHTTELDFLGLMAIPSHIYVDPPNDAPCQLPPSYLTLRDLNQRQRCKGLSLGMSGDLRLAINAGSTCVRIGQALFGARESPAVTNAL